MKIVNELYLVTQELHSSLHDGMPENVEERDEYISSVEKLLSVRQQLIDRLPSEYSAEDKQIGKRIVAINLKIDKLLFEQFKVMKNNFETFKRKQQRSKQYMNPYNNAAADGMYFDKKN